MSSFKDSSLRYFPQTSEAWIHAAGVAGGRSAQIVGFVIWQRVKLDYNRLGADPLTHYTKVTRKRVCAVSPMSDGTFRRALSALVKAGLADAIRESTRQAYKVRLIPLPDEIETTRRLLRWSNERPRKTQTHTKRN